MTKIIETKKWIGLLIYPFFVFTAWSANGQSSLLQSYQDVLNFDFSTPIGAQRDNNSGIPNFDLYVDNLREVTYLLFTENEKAFDSLRRNEKPRLKTLKNVEKPSPYTNFLRAEIKIQWAFTKLKFGETWSGVWALRSAYKTIKRNIEAYPDFELNYKSLGLLHVIFGAVPDGYRWTLSLLGLEGDTQKGLKELYNIMDTRSPFSTEIRLVAALVESYLIEDHAAALKLVESENTGSLMAKRYVQVLILMKSHQSAKAADIMEEVLNALKSPETKPLFQYLLAEARFQEGNYPTARGHYRNFLQNFHGSNHTKDATFKWGLCEQFMGNGSTAQALYNRAMDIEADSEADKNAQKLMKARPFPDGSLLVIRYAIDGGFYNKADSVFKDINIGSFPPYQQFELVYRQARMRHLQENLTEASRLYKEVIAKDEEMPETYFVPNSYLQLGYLEVKRGNDQMAIDYFEKVLTFRKHPYKNSLDSKAKIALKALQKSGD